MYPKSPAETRSRDTRARHSAPQCLQRENTPYYARSARAARSEGSPQAGALWYGAPTSWYLFHTWYDSAVTLNESGASRSETYPSTTSLSMLYNDAGQLGLVQKSGSDLARSVAYTAASDVAQQTLGNGLIQKVDYNPRLQPIAISLGTAMASTSVLQIAYTYGEQANSALPVQGTITASKNNGNIARQTIYTGSGVPFEQDYAYDPLNRLQMAKEYYDVPAPDFTLSASPTSVSVAKGSSGTSSISIVRGTGFTSTVSLAASGQPTGVTVSFSPASIANPSTTSTMTMTVDSSVTPTTYPILVTATGGGQTHMTNVSLTVTSAGDFTLSASTTSMTIPPGTSGNVTLTTVASGGFNSALTLTGNSAISLGVTWSYTPTTISAPGNGTSTLTINVPSSGGGGSISITASGGGKSHSVTVNFTSSSGGGSTDKALQYTGGTTDSYVRAADSPSLSAQADLTVEAWVKPSSVTGTHTIVSKRKDNTGGTDYGGYELRLVGNTVVFETYKQSGQVKATKTSTATVSAGAWYHVAGSFDDAGNGTGTIYVSVATASGTTTVVSVGVATGGAPDGGTPLNIGRSFKDQSGMTVGETFFGGKIDEVRISSAALYTASGATPSKTLSVVTGQTLALWHFDEGSGTTAADATGTNGGTLMGTTLPTWTTGVTAPGSKRKRAPKVFEREQPAGLEGWAPISATDGLESGISGKVDSYTPGWSESYGYDQWGNLTMPGGPTPSGATNRVPTDGYDNAGNVKTDGGTGNTLFYDGENRLWKVENPVGTLRAQFWYDGDGRRVKKQVFGSGAYTMRFVYDVNGMLIAEYTTNVAPASPSKEYFYGPSGLLATSESGTMSFVTPDHLGSPRVVTNGTGVVTGRHDYLPFGNDVGLADNRSMIAGYMSSDTLRHKFTAKERDVEIGLDYSEARYYGSGRGRFTSVDPLGSSGQASSPQSWNRYTYVFNNPLLFVDPSGMYSDYYNEKGKKIGTDGVNNGNAYIVPASNEAKQIGKTDKSKGVTPLSSVTSAVPLPSYDVRQAIGTAVKASDSPNATDKKGGNHEEGGISGRDKNGNTVISPAVPGATTDLKTAPPGSTATVDPFKAANPAIGAQIVNVDLAYHVHPKDTYTYYDATGTPNVRFYGQEPSPASIGPNGDLSRASAGHQQLVVGARDKTVYFYGPSGITAKFPLDKFLKIK